MKSLVVTLLIIGALFLGYDYFLAPAKERVVFRGPGETAKKTQPSSVEQASAPKAGPEPARPPVAPVLTNPSPPPAKSQAVSSTTLSPASALPRPETPKKGKPAFVPPRFDPIEALTGSWKKIPATAFPRAVKLLKDTTFKFSVGSSVVRAGAEVIALKMENGQLIVAPNESSPARQAVPVDDTDLKTTLSRLYEKWKLDRVAEARKRFEEDQLHPKPVVAETEPVLDPSGKPLQATNGTYPLLLGQLRKGTPSEITPNNIIRWKGPVEGTYKGQPTWIIEITYKTKTMFGEMDVDTLAHIQSGKVVDWVFKGTGEPVP